MKQATLKAAGTAALGAAIAVVAAGSASAAAPGGLGLPTSALTNPGLTGAATGAVAKVPGGDQVTQVAGTLNPDVAAPLAPAPAAQAPAAQAPVEQAPAAQAPAAEAPAAQAPVEQVPAAQTPLADPAAAMPAMPAAPAAANRVGGLDSVPGGQGLAKTPVGGVVGTLSGLSPTGGGAPSLPGLGG
ncbi:hypothetical protein ACGFX4_05945 [Kitasatospora sp. NPDC048365]|uniref:hypothetical protein n=1 Tax=Kitasatospora sp. NPDC048365 TaxID=3364050 RepID=UPI003717E4CC